jgi:hypothetical protein
MLVSANLMDRQDCVKGAILLYSKTGESPLQLIQGSLKRG